MFDNVFYLSDKNTNFEVWMVKKLTNGFMKVAKFVNLGGVKRYDYELIEFLVLPVYKWKHLVDGSNLYITQLNKKVVTAISKSYEDWLSCLAKVDL